MRRSFQEFTKQILKMEDLINLRCFDLFYHITSNILKAVFQNFTWYIIEYFVSNHDLQQSKRVSPH